MNAPVIRSRITLTTAMNATSPSQQPRLEVGLLGFVVLLRSLPELTPATTKAIQQHRLRMAEPKPVTPCAMQ